MLTNLLFQFRNFQLLSARKKCSLYSVLCKVCPCGVVALAASSSNHVVFVRYQNVLNLCLHSDCLQYNINKCCDITAVILYFDTSICLQAVSSKESLSSIFFFCVCVFCIAIKCVHMEIIVM